ncbi:ankyrin repeat domain-containing protein [Acinetobacter bohemicus]|uniref:Ankyrin repeat domain-containing protein n=1 Tax=Acinetobacter lwoffii TaxID=28090 RepID=A0A9D2UR02_ACILW|nr:MULTISPECIES: ankyrin repeat domain-containing protein [Acinetobacter]HJF27073.1 ankyrin repeat domain-containing protein [Acinetobacter lwoffii]MCO8042346.1 ankyrin repeat domain-containing protein [Acinetobacter sp. S4400-12]MCO8045167.1 ankyrin repeat domain-containing protein [Acinetobacter sp. S4397-1]MCU7224692.1 ankyrin repeat domain-containing protein [Acinetobacter bohemicus]QKQ68825.1 ankyrin repeat domain-containing protein [Acinetobacter sp. 10FS3-1]
MLTAQQQLFVQAIEDLDLEQVTKLLADGLNPNFIDLEKGPVISVWSDGLFKWWEDVCEAYEANSPLSDEEKQARLDIHLQILEALIQAKVNLHLWDAEEIYGPLWDAASAACVPAVQRLLDEQVNPNTKDEDGQTILSSISDLFFDCDFDEINWSEALEEEKQTLQLLRDHGAKMTKELN